MRSSGRQSVVRPRRAYVGVLALFLLMSVYQCGEVPTASAPPGPRVSAVAKTVAPAAVATDSIVAGLVVPAEAVDVGDEFEIEVFVDLSGSDAALGAYEARLSWDASVLSLVEVSDGSTAEFARAYHRAESGALVFSQFNAQGAGGRLSLLRVRFSVVGSGSSGLVLSFSVLDAAGTFASLLPSLVVEPTVVEIGGAADGSIVAGLVASADAVDVGDEFEVEVFVDLGSSGAALGAYEARLSWDASVLSLVEVSDGSTPEFDRAYHREESGALVFSQLNARGAGGRLSLLRVRFLVVGSGLSGLVLSFSVLDAAGTFASLLPSLVVEPAADGEGGSTGEERVFSLPGGGEMVFVWIEPGVFQMGSPESESGRFSHEGPLHEVELSEGFWLGKYEVTVGQFRRFVDATGYDAGNVCGTIENNIFEYRSWRSWRNPGYSPSDNQPVVCVNWYDVQAYASWLSSETGVLHRLPTEAEWEYACRAGTSTRWSFGDDESQLTHYAWYNENVWGEGKPLHAQVVGLKRANAWKLHDMHGNVWEQVQDILGNYNSSRQVDPLGPPVGGSVIRVVRGGSFFNYADWLRSAHRGEYDPSDRTFDVGVRLLRVR